MHDRFELSTPGQAARKAPWRTLASSLVPLFACAFFVHLTFFNDPYAGRVVYRVARFFGAHTWYSYFAGTVFATAMLVLGSYFFALATAAILFPTRMGAPGYIEVSDSGLEYTTGTFSVSGATKLPWHDIAKLRAVDQPTNSLQISPLGKRPFTLEEARFADIDAFERFLATVRLHCPNTVNLDL